MNPTAQHQHRRVTDDLDARLTTVEEVVTALDARVSAVAVAAKHEIDEERGERLKVDEAHRQYMVGAVRAIERDLFDLRDRPLLGRLKWLVTGR